MKRKILFLIGMALSFGSTYAQSEKPDNDQRQHEKAIESLKEDLEDRDKTIRELEADLAELNAENEKLDSALRAERKEGKAAKYRRQIKQLKEDSTALSERMEEALEKMRQEHQKQVDLFVAQHKEDSLVNVDLRAQLAELEEFRVIHLAQMAESVDEKWLNKAYADVDSVALETDFAQYDQYAPMDTAVAQARDKLAAFVANVRLYRQGRKAVHSKYEADVVSPLIEPMRALRNRLPEGSNKDDVANICWQLDNYAITVEIFQDVIKAVNKAVEGQKTAKAAWYLAQAELNKQEKESEYISAIQDIPWLKEQYGVYYKLLEKDASKPNEVGEKILKLLTPQ